jgi:hypothetical protein
VRLGQTQSVVAGLVGALLVGLKYFLVTMVFGVLAFVPATCALAAFTGDSQTYGYQLFGLLVLGLASVLFAAVGIIVGFRRWYLLGRSDWDQPNSSQ